METPEERIIAGFERSGLSYGDVVSHNDIDAWIDLEFPDMSGLPIAEQKDAFKKHELTRFNAVEALKNYCLTERKMFLDSVRSTGYLIANPGQQTELVVDKGHKLIRRGLKTITRGVKHVNVAMLTSAEREYRNSVLAREKGLAHMLNQKRVGLPEPD
jgi:hypothetical protein